MMHHSQPLVIETKRLAPGLAGSRRRRPIPPEVPLTIYNESVDLSLKIFDHLQFLIAKPVELLRYTRECSNEALAELPKTFQSIVGISLSQALSQRFSFQTVQHLAPLFKCQSTRAERITTELQFWAESHVAKKDPTAKLEVLALLYEQRRISPKSFSPAILEAARKIFGKILRTEDLDNALATVLKGHDQKGLKVSFITLRQIERVLNARGQVPFPALDLDDSFLRLERIIKKSLPDVAEYAAVLHRLAMSTMPSTFNAELLAASAHQLYFALEEISGDNIAKRINQFREHCGDKDYRAVYAKCTGATWEYSLSGFYPGLQKCFQELIDTGQVAPVQVIEAAVERAGGDPYAVLRVLEKISPEDLRSAVGDDEKQKAWFKNLKTELHGDASIDLLQWQARAGTPKGMQRNLRTIKEELVDEKTSSVTNLFRTFDYILFVPEYLARHSEGKLGFLRHLRRSKSLTAYFPLLSRIQEKLEIVQSQPQPSEREVELLRSNMLPIINNFQKKKHFLISLFADNVSTAIAIAAGFVTAASLVPSTALIGVAVGLLVGFSAKFTTFTGIKFLLLRDAYGRRDLYADLVFIMVRSLPFAIGRNHLSSLSLRFLAKRAVATGGSKIMRWVDHLNHRPNVHDLLPYLALSENQLDEQKH